MALYSFFYIEFPFSFFHPCFFVKWQPTILLEFFCRPQLHTLCLHWSAVFDQFYFVDGTLLMREWTCFGIEKMLSRGLYGPRMRQHSCSNSVVVQFPSLILDGACKMFLTSCDEIEGFSWSVLSNALLNCWRLSSFPPCIAFPLNFISLKI